MEEMERFDRREAVKEAEGRRCMRRARERRVTLLAPFARTGDYVVTRDGVAVARVTVRRNGYRKTTVVEIIK